MMIASKDTKIRLFQLIMILLMTWIMGLVFFVTTSWYIKSSVAHDTELIVVPTGDVNRINLGFDLLKQASAKVLLISGVGHGVRLSDLAKSGVAVDTALKSQVILGRVAGNTEGNAVEARVTMQMMGYSKMCIVTSDYHVLRSYLLFRKYNPKATISIFKTPSGTFSPRKAWLLVREYNATIVLLTNWGYDMTLARYHEWIRPMLRYIWG